MSENNRIDPIKLNIRVIVDEMSALGWDLDAKTDNDTGMFINFVIFDGQKDLNHQYVYFIPSGMSEGFPVHEYAYISCDPVNGVAPHICVSGKTDIQVINTLNAIAQKYRGFEKDLSDVLLSGGTLNDLCLVALKTLNNPLFIHDNMFCVLALPQYVEGMREFEVDRITGKKYVPLWLVNEFKFDEEYQKSLTARSAQFWGSEQFPRKNRCLIVNLWEGSFYLGRLLIEELWSTISPGQILLAEYFALYASAVIIRDKNLEDDVVSSYDHVLRSMLEGETVDTGFVTRFMSVMSWEESDTYICVKLVSQDEDAAVKSAIPLRSRFAELFKSFFCFYSDYQCCLIVNLTRSGLSGSDVEGLLAPIVRESYLYAGLSNSFRDIRYVYQAFKQVDHVVSEVRKSPGKWVNSFSRCVLDYMIRGVKQDMSVSMIIDRELLGLLEFDKANNSFLYVTLKTYLENERDITKTAELLSVHRTTLIYRLGRIEKFFKMDLDDPDNRLYLLICFKMIEQMEDPV